MATNLWQPIYSKLCRSRSHHVSCAVRRASNAVAPQISYLCDEDCGTPSQLSITKWSRPSQWSRPDSYIMLPYASTLYRYLGSVLQKFPTLLRTCFNCTVYQILDKYSLYDVLSSGSFNAYITLVVNAGGLRVGWQPTAAKLSGGLWDPISEDVAP